MTDAQIRDNVERHRYELPVGNQMAVVTYNLSEPNPMITETLVPQALEGQGIASRLAKDVIADATERGLLILPVCPFFSAYFQKHPELAQVVHPRYRDILGI
ncbi:GNAT family N-acetyltransferase [Brevundimonas sp. TWP2-3-4b1]|uniref:GNAT family N-acetyltransferase n=1 Tax=Brevundimonas sp. TWP2-3-4b1 TaxID=2804580 RepID=UPI003CF93491